MPPAVDSMQARLLLAVREAAETLPRLAALLPEPDTGGPRTGTIGRHAPESSEPWNVAAADAYWGLWFGVGHVVNALRSHLGLRPWRVPPRGHDALDAVLNLAPGCTPEAVKLAVLRIERWTRRAGELPAIDEAEPWISLPVLPGTGAPPPCPYCRTWALRMRKRAGEVRCFFPGCVDADQRPTRARMESGRMTGEERLVFGDGMMLTFEGEAA
jgi:hypothetical protein